MHNTLIELNHLSQKRAEMWAPSAKPGIHTLMSIEKVEHFSG
jgi:hypothetical protein